MEDFYGDVCVRAVAVQQFAGNRDAGLAQFGDAGVEQRSGLYWALEVSGVFAGQISQ